MVLGLTKNATLMLIMVSDVNLWFLSTTKKHRNVVICENKVFNNEINFIIMTAPRVTMDGN
jgi:mRNA-degrading endonuclease toxin of MazEF toxin-antitoxin module